MGGARAARVSMCSRMAAITRGSVITASTCSATLKTMGLAKTAVARTPPTLVSMAAPLAEPGRRG